MHLRAADDLQVTACIRALAGRLSRAPGAWRATEREAIGSALERDQVDDGREGIRSVEHGSRSLDDLDPLEDVHRKGFEQVADEAALEDLARRSAVDQKQDVPAVDLGLIAAGGHHAAVGEVRRARREPRHALEDFPQRRASEAPEFVLADDGDNARCVRLTFRELGGGDDLDVQQRFQVEREQILRREIAWRAARPALSRRRPAGRAHDQKSCHEDEGETACRRHRLPDTAGTVWRARPVPRSNEREWGGNPRSGRAG